MGTISAAAVAYYATPYEIATRLWIIPGAMTGVLFPLLPGSFLPTDCVRFQLRVGNKGFVSWPITGGHVAVPVCSRGAYLVAGVGLRGQAIRRQNIARWCFAYLGHVAITVLHGAGRADWSAKLHLVELPFYLLVSGFTERKIWH